MRKIQFVLFAISLSLGSCQIFQPSVMLRTPHGYKFDPTPDSTAGQYRISKNDQFSFRLYSNDGFKLIEFMAEGSNSASGRSAISSGVSYVVGFDGTVKLPLLRRVKLEGMTVREAELFLEEQYSQYYNNPFSLVEVNNRRVMVFPGSEGTAKVLNLTNEQTTLLEALAFSGGIASNGVARKIKLVRTQGGKTEIYKIDLSTIEGLEFGKIILQANDIIYVHPQFNISKELLSEISPIISLISATLVIITLSTRF